MARLKKDTVEYFPHDADATAGDTLTALQGQFGNDGYAFWFKLLEKLASSDGHFIDCRVTKRWQVILGRSRVDEDVGLEIMALLAEMHAIDAELWNDYKIIWCEKFVDNLDAVYRNRRRDLPGRPTPIPADETPVSTLGNCMVCGETLDGKRADANCCSDKCRKELSRINNAKCDKQLQTKLNSASKENITTVEKGVSTMKKGVSTVVIPQSRVEYSRVKESKVDNSILVSSQKNEQKVLDAYQRNIGELTERIKVLISQAINEYSSEWVYKAIAEAVMQNKLTWVYIAGILKNWQQSGNPTH